MGTFILSFGSIVILSFILWVIALVHAATNKNFKDSNSKLVWVLIILFTHIIGALLYLLFGRPKTTKRSSEKRLLKVGLLFGPFFAMPLGIKILTILYSLSLIGNVFNFGQYYQPIHHFFQINPPFSVIYGITFILIESLIIISLFKHYKWGWRLIFLKEFLTIIPYTIFKLPKTIKAIFSPAQDIYKIDPETFSKIGLYGPTPEFEKLVYITMDVFLLLIPLIILLYVYGNRNYFNK